MHPNIVEKGEESLHNTWRRSPPLPEEEISAAYSQELPTYGQVNGITKILIYNSRHVS